VAGVVRAETEIDAPVERVRAILGDLAAYPDWNPFTPGAESTLQVGDPIQLRVRLLAERPMRWQETISAVQPDRLCWKMKLGAHFLLAAERCQILTALDAGRTRYVSEDRFQGLLAPLVLLLFGRAMQRGFSDCAMALKKRAES